ncbi:putative ferric-chelate reductase 1 [Aplysia californica]|uniref:Ferric-chelate reductase 1 n=1 Tax=Aplysia californica TaxID=6500 RepID=A0ABM0ZU75_APLCA|nr:putative ferric-chelate reductase 1 [Aplysia californica]
MVPALGLVSLAWAVSCLVLTSDAAVQDLTQCCKCDSLMPTDTPDGRQPQVMPSPFRIQVQEEQYGLGSEIHVNLVATEGRAFRSFILGAYPYPYIRGKKPVGQLTLLDGQDFEVGRECDQTEGQPGAQASAFAVVSRDEKPKTKLMFVWTPNRRHGHIEFRATFIENDDTYWVSEKSAILEDPTPGNRPLPRSRYTPPIITSECGTYKGCFREPAGCEEAQCLYILTWRSTPENTVFELGGLADGAADRYVAVGLSDDTYMGGDTVFTCAHNSATESTEVYLSYNQDDPKKNVPVPKYEEDAPSYSSRRSKYGFLLEEKGSYENARLRCKFTVRRDLDQYYDELKSLRGGPQHLLFAHGFAKKGSPSRHGLSVEELPLASASRVDIASTGDYNDRARYSLAKAHGCLMILAWVLFASIGLLLTKYYKPMWPNQRMFEHKYWFLGHFNCMAMVFIITIIAIILIFVEAGGYSEAPDLPQKAHPILGIIILVCIIINPVLALIRPSEDSSCRPVFNWFHWAFGTIANVLAIPQIFIGMDFGKVMVPWWATWILVIWVIFHIVVELSLEIHQCCTYKKNKERRKKWEQLKREYPKQHHPEPEPAGRRFKRFMLFLHVGFTVLITLIMIIIIAVS